MEFLKALRKTLKQGQYDIIHSHHDYLSGFYLIASQGIKFKKRILQIHNTDEALPVGNKFLRKVLLSPLKLLAVHYSDLIVGISVHTLKQFIKKTSLKYCIMELICLLLKWMKVQIVSRQIKFACDS
ncbi:MAG: glycosyltransferase [Saprospiraceae bacterium]|nr:glycosyltransferase [Saprospiraceae bacterium]